MKLALATHDVVKGHGQGRVNYELISRVLGHGHDVILITARLAPDLAAHPRVRWIRVRTESLPTQLVRDFWFGLRAQRWLRSHAADYDLVMLNGASTWTASDVNVVHFVHGAWLRSRYHVARIVRGPYGWYQWLYSRVNATLERRAFARARVVVAISDQIERELRDVGVPSGRMTLIANGVDGVEFRPARVARGPLGLPEDVPLALFVGDIRSRRKNLEMVLEALPDTHGLHLAVVGHGAGSPYPPMARMLGVAERVHFIGYRTDIATLMQAADMFVFPSRYEANALVLLEALASGLPVVATRTGAAGTLITPDCGILLEDASDVPAMTEALRRLLDPQERGRMQVAARQRALQYSWDRMAAAYLALFEDLIRRRDASP